MRYLLKMSSEGTPVETPPVEKIGRGCSASNKEEEAVNEISQKETSPVATPWPRAAKETPKKYVVDADGNVPVKRRKKSRTRKGGSDAEKPAVGRGRPRKIQEKKPGATKFDLIRSRLLVLVEILFVPLAGLTVVVLLMIAVLRFFLATETALPVSVTTTMSCFCLFLLLYLRTRPTQTGKVVGWMQIVLSFCATGLLVWPHTETRLDDWYRESVPLTWSQYNSYCSAESAGPIRARAQEKCSSLAGLYVRWEGLVESTSVTGIQNPLYNMVSKLPLEAQSVITCMFGKNYEPCENHPECASPDFLSKQLNKCHLSNWNRYVYAIIIKMAAGTWMGDEAKVTLRADNVFRNFTTSLYRGDQIWFTGTLEVDPTGQNTFGMLRIHLHQAGCLSCAGSPHHH